MVAYNALWRGLQYPSMASAARAMARIFIFVEKISVARLETGRDRNNGSRLLRYGRGEKLLTGAATPAIASWRNSI